MAGIEYQAVPRNMGFNSHARDRGLGRTMRPGIEAGEDGNVLYEEN
jgi:hypothetical protein